MNYFSNTTQAFYAKSLRSVYVAAAAWPSDAQEVSDQQEEEIRILQMAGQLPHIVDNEVISTGQQPGYSVGSSSPQQCTPAKGLVALYALKQITEDHVLDAIAQIPDPVQQYTAKIGYQRATSWERASPTMQTMAQLLQLSEQDLDDLFSHAANVNV